MTAPAATSILTRPCCHAAYRCRTTRCWPPARAPTPVPIICARANRRRCTPHQEHHDDCTALFPGLAPVALDHGALAAGHAADRHRHGDHCFALAFDLAQLAQTAGTGLAGAGRAAPAAAPAQPSARATIEFAASLAPGSAWITLAAVRLHAGHAADRLGHAVGWQLSAALAGWNHVAAVTTTQCRPLRTAAFATYRAGRTVLRAGAGPYHRRPGPCATAARWRVRRHQPAPPAPAGQLNSALIKSKTFNLHSFALMIISSWLETINCFI